ncbi:MAG: hypothetical protein ACRCWD_07735 [Culicoidibacterales bacterium]
MNELHKLFYKLIQPYEQVVDQHNFRELHSFFGQQLPEIIEFAYRPQAKIAVQTLQKLYREFLFYTLYPNLKQTATVTVFGNYHQFLTSLDLAWYQLQTPTFIKSGEEMALGLNLFHMQQTFSYEELSTLPTDFSHLLQHLYVQTPKLETSQLVFLLPFQQEQFMLTDYFLYFLDETNKASCYAQIQQFPNKYHFIVADNQQLTQEFTQTNVIILSSLNFVTELAELELVPTHQDIFHAFEIQFSSYQHALELLINYEQRQLTLASSNLVRMAKHQSQLKQLQQELNMWQTFHLRFHRLIQQLLGDEAPMSPVLQPLLATTQVLQAFQKRTQRQPLTADQHPFEALLTVQATPQLATPFLAEQFQAYLQKNWHLPATIPFTHTLVPSEEGEV